MQKFSADFGLQVIECKREPKACHEFYLAESQPEWDNTATPKPGKAGTFLPSRKLFLLQQR